MAASDIYIIATLTFLAVLGGFAVYFDNDSDDESKKHHQ